MKTYASCGHFIPHFVTLFQRAETIGIDPLQHVSEIEHIAMTAFVAGQWNYVVLLRHRELEMKEEFLGCNYEVTLACMGNLASALRKHGRPTESEKL